MAAIFEPLFTKLKPTFYQFQHLSQWLSQSWDWEILWNPLRLSPWTQVKCSIIWDKSLKFESETGLRPFVKSTPDIHHNSKYHNNGHRYSMLVWTGNWEEWYQVKSYCPTLLWHCTGVTVVLFCNYWTTRSLAIQHVREAIYFNFEVFVTSVLEICISITFFFSTITVFHFAYKVVLKQLIKMCFLIHN